MIDLEQRAELFRQFRGVRLMTDLERARDRLLSMQKVLHTARLLQQSAPEPLKGYGKWTIAKAEQKVCEALDEVWLEQCRAIFPGCHESFYRSRDCAKFINATAAQAKQFREWREAAIFNIERKPNV